VRTLASEEFQGRAAGTAGGAKARAFVRERFEAIRLQTIGGAFEHAFTYPRKAGSAGGETPAEVQAANLVGRCPGRDGNQSVLVLSAHYDHLGVRDGKTYPGADDNASGVAALLEIAAQCMAQPFGRDLIVVAFDAEEGGLNGARAFVSSGTVPKERVAANVNLDMVARGDKGEIYIAGTQHNAALRPLLEPVATRAPIRVLFGHDRPGSGTDDWTLQSDHGVFHQAGVPFVYFGVEDHPDYHQPTDTADKINPDFFAKAVGVVLDALRALDRGLR
jgi:Zn-dependent M28 family amino/carboxypeptidase